MCVETTINKVIKREHIRGTSFFSSNRVPNSVPSINLQTDSRMKLP